VAYAAPRRAEAGGISVNEIKRQIVSDVKSSQELGFKRIEHGKDLLGKFKEVRSLIDSIDTSVDESDIQAVERLEESYGEATAEAMEEEVEERVLEVNESLEGVSDTAVEEKAKVDEALDKAVDMAGATEVGREGAERAAEEFKESGEFYKGQIVGIEKQIKKLAETSAKLMSDTRDLF
jgi:hypothetical protein